jgi:hypothetical protein
MIILISVPIKYEVYIYYLIVQSLCFQSEFSLQKYTAKKKVITSRSRRGRAPMVVRFITTYATNAYHH